MSEIINVLDKGYVRLVDVMGSDLSVVNSARASFAKESEEFNERDERLIHFLVREGHFSPMRHAMATFEVKAPLMVARQWWKYVVGSDHTMDGWNEASRRYITMEPEFYIPSSEQWREKPENSKQGSGDCLDESIGQEQTEALTRHMYESLGMYNYAMYVGVAPEQARLFLPAYAMYTVWRWTASLQSILHFLRERTAEDAQYEIREYANAVKELIEPHFPVSVKAALEG